MEEVPADVLFCNILSRLPPKSLLRFTSVSKEWLSFLRTPAFVNMQLHHQNHHNLTLFSTTSTFKFYTIDCEAPENGLTSAHQSQSLPFKVGPYQSISIVASLHGMLCLAISKSGNIGLEYSDLILWNPFTGDHKTLSKPSFHKECLTKIKSPFGFYYISSEDDYRLVRLTHHLNLYIYSLKSDSWRKVELAEYFPRIHNLFSYVWSESPCLFLNEKLYFLRYMHTFRGSISILIICFDTKTEKLREIATPPFANHITDCSGFMVLRGCIHLCVSIEDFTMELWRLDGDKDWTKVETYRQIAFFYSSDKICHIMRNGNWLIHSSHAFYQLEMKKHTKDKVVCVINSMNFHLGEKYVETIVSPNQYIKGHDRKARDWMGLWTNFTKYVKTAWILVHLQQYMSKEVA